MWIDVSKGGDVPAAGAPAAPAAAGTAPLVVAQAAPAAPPPRASIEDELDRAAEVLGRAKGAVIALFGEARLGKAVDSDICLPIVDEVTSSLARNPSAFVSLARLKTKDDYTYLHSVAVCGLMVVLARHMDMPDDAPKALL